MRKTITRLLLLILLSGSTAKAQLIDSMMTVYAEGFPKEKIHIHFDKELYNSDETIWYKVYLMSGNALSPLSKNIYVEWYDTTGLLIKQTVAPLFQATAKGTFDIPANYKGSFIHLRAYTRWMLNDDSTFLFDRDIAINSGSTVATKPKLIPTKLELFPEGGDMVQNLLNPLAFKATNIYGIPVKIKGAIVDDKNKLIDSIRVKHDGMGKLNFMPLEGEQYAINWVDEFGVKGVTKIPPPKKNGIVMSVQPNNEKAVVTFQRSVDVPESFKQLYLMVHMNQELLYKVSIKLKDRLAQRAEIPIEELPTGIVQFTLFTEDFIPVAERIIFVNNHYHELNAKLNPITIGLDKRAKNVFEIIVSDTTVTNMSVAVTDANITVPERHSIYSDFLLSNEIKGYVHNPAYYFKSDNDTINTQLDLVMLTNGWRRIDWSKIKAEVAPQIKYYPETAYMSLKGKVFGAKSAGFNEPLQLNFVIVGKDSSKSLYFTPVEKDGSFEEPGVFFYDTSKVFYNFNGNSKLSAVTQVKIENGLLRKEPSSTIAFSLNNPINGRLDSLYAQRMNFFLSEQEKLKRSMASATLKEVIVKSRQKSPTQLLDEKYASGLFAGGDGYSFDLTDDKVIGAYDIFTFLQGKVPGLQISNTASQPSLTWRGATPDLFLNEMRSDISLIQNLNINDIAYVKVIRPPFFGSFGGGAGGAISVYLKKGADGRKALPNSKGMDNAILGGYSRFKEFYSPTYDKQSTNYDPDLRNTLYWNPYIITNKKTPRFRAEFFNNDVSRKLQIVLEGVNLDGKMIRIVKMLE
jgi:hypothetical protein